MQRDRNNGSKPYISIFEERGERYSIGHITYPNINTSYQRSLLIPLSSDLTRWHAN